MKASQRWLIVVALFLIAVASAAYCLDYSAGDYYTIGDGRLYLFRDGIPFSAATPVIKLSESDPRVIPGTTGLFVVTVAGLYPRAGLSVIEAAIGGLLFPAILIVATAYAALGAPRTGTFGGSRIVSEGKLRSRTPMDPDEAMPRLAAVAVAILPVLFVLDTPSTMLLTRLKLPRWLFAILVFRALARR